MYINENRYSGLTIAGFKGKKEKKKRKAKINLPVSKLYNNSTISSLLFVEVQPG